MTSTDAVSSDVIAALHMQNALGIHPLVSLVELNEIDDTTISMIYLHRGFGEHRLGFVVTTARLPGWDEGTTVIGAADFADGILDFLDEPPSGAFFRTQPNSEGVRWLR